MAVPCSPRPRIAVVAVVVAVVVAGAIAIDVHRPTRAAGALRADDPVVYRPAVDAPVLDPFRAPPHRYGPGNRGIDYAVGPGRDVRAMADGDVLFAGPVAGALHVTIRHGDGLRSSYSFLATVAVHPGQRVAIGDVIGRSGEVLHVGVRTPDGTYLDPASLFGPPRHARLVPGGDDGTGAVPGAALERSDLAAIVAERATPLGALLARARGVAPDLVSRARLWQHLVAEADWATHTRRIGTGLTTWWHERDRCTPADQPAPAGGGGRILVEVAGIGSTSEAAAVDDVDVGALGYEPSAVVRFSYRGGRVPARTTDAGPDHGPLGALPVTAYDATDSQAPLGDSADELVALLRAIAAARPGAPIDLVAHSQGGVVARLAIGRGAAGGVLPPEVAHLVTLGTPHGGADAAGAAVVGRDGAAVGTVIEAGPTVLGLELDASSAAVRDLAPGSALLAEVGDRQLPASVSFTSIAARGDVVVPAPRSAGPDGRTVVVPLAGPSAHDRLPGAPETTRELGLALAGRAATCRGLSDAVADLVTGEQVAYAEATGALLVGAVAVTGPR